MNYEPLSEEEINRSQLLPDGQYQAELLSMVDKDKFGNALLTTKGFEKIDLVLKVYDVNGKAHPIKDMLTPAFMKKLKHFCDVTGLDAEYKRGLCAEDASKVNSTFVVNIGTRSFKHTQTHEDIYMNNVLDYLPLKSASPGTGLPLSKPDDFLSDDIPF